MDDAHRARRRSRRAAIGREHNRVVSDVDVTLGKAVRGGDELHLLSGVHGRGSGCEEDFAHPNREVQDLCDDGVVCQVDRLKRCGSRRDRVDGGLPVSRQACEYFGEFRHQGAEWELRMGPTLSNVTRARPP